MIETASLVKASHETNMGGEQDVLCEDCLEGRRPCLL